MPSVHSRFVAAAIRLIDRHGREMSLLEKSEGGTEYRPVITQTEKDIVGVQTYFARSDIDGDLVRSSDKKVIIDSTVVPTTAMRLRDSGTDYSIVDVIEIKPGTTAILYKLQVRL